MGIRIRIRIRNLYCPYLTEKHQGTRKYINKDIWIPTHYKQTKTLSENTKQWYKIIEYNVERKWQWNDLYTLWYIPQAIAAIIHPGDTEPDEGATAVKRYNRIDYELIGHSYGTVMGVIAMITYRTWVILIMAQHVISDSSLSTVMMTQFTGSHICLSTLRTVNQLHQISFYNISLQSRPLLVHWFQITLTENQKIKNKTKHIYTEYHILLKYMY